MRTTIWILGTILLLCGVSLVKVGLSEGVDFFTIVGMTAIFCFIVTVSLEIKGILKGS